MISLLDKWATEANAKWRFRERGLMTVAEASHIRGSVVYVLCDDQGESFYVGKTTRPNTRFLGHGRTGGLNATARLRHQMLGDRLRVSIVVWNPADLDKAERQEIVRRPWCLNVIKPGHRWWDCPPVARHRRCVTDFLFRKIERAGAADWQSRAAKKMRNKMNARDRLEYELEMYGELLPFEQIQFVSWAERTLGLLEQSDMSTECFRRIKWRVQVQYAAAKAITDEIFNRARAECHGGA